VCVCVCVRTRLLCVHVCVCGEYMCWRDHIVLTCDFLCWATELVPEAARRPFTLMDDAGDLSAPWHVAHNIIIVT